MCAGAHGVRSCARVCRVSGFARTLCTGVRSVCARGCVSVRGSRVVERFAGTRRGVHGASVFTSAGGSARVSAGVRECTGCTLHACVRPRLAVRPPVRPSVPQPVRPPARIAPRLGSRRAAAGGQGPLGCGSSAWALPAPRRGRARRGLRGSRGGLGAGSRCEPHCVSIRVCLARLPKSAINMTLFSFSGSRVQLKSE